MYVTPGRGSGDDRLGIFIQRDDLEEWLGHTLTDREVGDLVRHLPHSSLREVVESVVGSWDAPDLMTTVQEAGWTKDTLIEVLREFIAERCLIADVQSFALDKSRQPV